MWEVKVEVITWKVAMSVGVFVAQMNLVKEHDHKMFIVN